MPHILRIFCVVLFLVAPVAMAQIDGTGLYRFGSFDSRGLDSINLGNLNTHFEIPIVSKQGRGVNFNYALVYDGLVWSQTSSSGTGYWQHDASWGFHGRLGGALLGYVTYNSKTIRCPTIEGIPQYGYQLSSYVYHDPYGGNHRFAYSYQECDEAEGYPKILGDGSTSDGSGLSYGVNTGVIRTQSGSLISAPENVGVNQSSYASIKDSNGNTITNNGNGTFTDTLGVTALTIGGGAAYGNPLTFTYPVALQGDQATSATITVYFKTYTVQTHFQCSGISEYGAVSADLIDHIVLPDAAASTYTFTYETTPTVAGAVTGRLASITLPTGGTINYSYSGGCNNSGINADGTPATLTRTTSDGSKVYSRTINGTASTTDVTDEKQNHANYSFTSSSENLWYETERKIWQGVASGTPLQDRITQYNGQTTTSSSWLTTPITQTDVLESFNGGAQSDIRNLYDSSGLLTTSSQYDPGNGGALLAYDSYTYGSAGKMTGVISRDAASQIVAQSSYGYDESTPTGTTSIPNHLNPSGLRGNRTSTHVWLGGASGTLDSYATYYDTGVPVSTTTPNGVTQYTYDSTQAFVNQVTLPTPSSGVQISTSANYDQQSGVQSSATGPNSGQTTQIAQYDRLLRPISIAMQDGGQTTYSYAPNQVGISSKIDATRSSDREIFYDSYGRVRRSAVFNGSVWYLTDSCYDAAGLLQYQSVPYSSSSNTSAQVCSGEAYTYDALGRPTNVAHPDGTSNSATYYSHAVKTSNSQGVSRITQHDLLGRTSAVCEISSNASMPGSGTPQACGTDIAGTGFLTSYSYDLVNHKTTITQGAQTRIFQTDAAGRTIYSSEPERGATTYGYVYNSTGLVITRQRPRANQSNPSVLTTTTTQYDSLGRVVSIAYDDGTPTKSFSYDQATAWGGSSLSLGASKGHLTEVIASTSPDFSGGFFVYDVMGRVVRMDQCLPSGCASGNYERTLLYGYDLSGNILQSSDGSGVTTTNTFSLAHEITSITSSLNDSTHPPNLVSSAQNGPYGPLSYQLGNGLGVAIRYDGSGRVNAKWLCSGSSQYDCSGGTQTYGFGTTTAGEHLSDSCDSVLGRCSSYGYDEFNRLTLASVYYGAVQNFNYVYDRYGNRWQQNAPQGGPAPSYSFNTSNNQVNGLGYDAAGNLTNDGFHTYTYDAEGNITQVDNGSTAKYTYNVFNQRVRKEAGSTDWEYVYNLNGQRVSIWDGSTHNQIQGQAYWGGSPIEFYSGGTAHFQHQNWLGTERMRTSYNGSVEASFTSLAFGDAFSSLGTDDDPYHFAQLDHDSEASTDHAQFRQYSSTQGRWMSPDPYDGSYNTTDPQSFNRYSYIGNSPMSLADPTGLTPIYPCTEPRPGGHGTEGDICDHETVNVNTTEPTYNVPGIPSYGEGFLGAPDGGGHGGSIAPSKSCQTGFGVGVVGGADAGAGAGPGAIATGSGGGAVLFNGFHLPNLAGFLTGGLAAGSRGYPTQSNGSVVGIGAGGAAGGGLFFTNATNASQLNGPSLTFSGGVDVGVGLGVSLSFGTDAAGHTIWTGTITGGYGLKFYGYAGTTKTKAGGTGPKC